MIPLRLDTECWPSINETSNNEYYDYRYRLAEDAPSASTGRVSYECAATWPEMVHQPDVVIRFNFLVEI